MVRPYRHLSMNVPFEHIEQELSHFPTVKPRWWFRVRMNYVMWKAIRKEQLSGFGIIRSLIPRLVTAMVMIAVVTLSSATTLYAYYSSDVTATSPLYGLRRGVERARMAFAWTPEDQVDVYLSLAERRAQEARQMIGRGILDIETISAVARNTDFAVSTARQLPDREDVQNKVQVASSRRMETLHTVKTMGVSLKAKENHIDPANLINDPEDKIYLSAPVEAESNSVVKQSTAKNWGPYGKITNGNEVTIVGIIPPADSVITEQTIIKQTPGLQAIVEAIQDVEDATDATLSPDTTDAAAVHTSGTPSTDSPNIEQ